MRAVMISVSQAEFPGGCFVRLSSRSPKDAAFFSPQARKYIDQALEGVPAADLSTRARIALESSLRAMRLEDAGEILWLIAASQRIWLDLLVFVRQLEADSEVVEPIQLILREWAEIPLWTEVRVFVWDGKVTAMSQYFHFLYFPELQDQQMQQEWVARVLDFFNTELSDLPAQACILDVAVLEGEVLLLEFNPWGAATGPGLFDWCQDEPQLKADGAVECAIEFRCRHEPQVCFDGVSLLPHGWEQLYTDDTMHP